MNTTSVFERLLGHSFATLPKPIRRLHTDRTQKAFSGFCNIERGTGYLATLFGYVTSLPESGNNIPVHIIITHNDPYETWARCFGQKSMISTLTARDGLLIEQLGPVRFKFALRTDGDCILWSAVGAKVFGIPLPAAWFKHVVAKESIYAERYVFEVNAALPIIGLIVNYKGWLDVGD